MKANSLPAMSLLAASPDGRHERLPERPHRPCSPQVSALLCQRIKSDPEVVTGPAAAGAAVMSSAARAASTHPLTAGHFAACVKARGPVGTPRVPLTHESMTSLAATE